MKMKVGMRERCRKWQCMMKKRVEETENERRGKVFIKRQKIVKKMKAGKK